MCITANVWRAGLMRHDAYDRDNGSSDAQDYAQAAHHKLGMQATPLGCVMLLCNGECELSHDGQRCALSKIGADRIVDERAKVMDMYGDLA